MFFISFPTSFNVGDTADCRINKEPARVTWRDADHLVIEPDDARAILAIEKGPSFFPPSQRRPYGTRGLPTEMEPSGDGFIISEKPKHKEPRA